VACGRLHGAHFIRSLSTGWFHVLCLPQRPPLYFCYAMNGTDVWLALSFSCARVLVLEDGGRTRSSSVAACWLFSGKNAPTTVEPPLRPVAFQCGIASAASATGWDIFCCRCAAARAFQPYHLPLHAPWFEYLLLELGLWTLSMAGSFYGIADRLNRRPAPAPSLDLFLLLPGKRTCFLSAPRAGTDIIAQFAWAWTANGWAGLAAGRRCLGFPAGITSATLKALPRCSLWLTLTRSTGINRLLLRHFATLLYYHNQACSAFTHFGGWPAFARAALRWLRGSFLSSRIPQAHHGAHASTVRHHGRPLPATAVCRRQRYPKPSLHRRADDGGALGDVLDETLWTHFGWNLVWAPPRRRQEGGRCCLHFIPILFLTSTILALCGPLLL